MLVTGGAGFIGFFLAKHLADTEQQVTICDNLFRGKEDDEFKRLLERKNVTFVRADLTKPEHLIKLDTHYDHVYHLAAINGTKYFYEIPHTVLRVNTLSAINILDWFVESKSKKILFSSSSETYAGLTNAVPFQYPTPEDVPLGVADLFNPRWSYGGSKLLGELLFANYAKQFKRRMSIVRYTNVYGPRMGHEHVVSEFIGRILRKESPFKIFGAEPTRTFCYVTDAVRATQLVMESEKTDGRVLNIGSDAEELPIIELAKRMFTLFNYHPTVELHPAPLGTAKRRCPNIARLKALGFQNKVKLDDGLRETYAWYKEHAGE